MKSTGGNTGFASGGGTCKLGVLCFYSSSVQVESFELRIPPNHLHKKSEGQIILQLSMDAHF